MKIYFMTLFFIFLGCNSDSLKKEQNPNNKNNPFPSSETDEVLNYENINFLSCQEVNDLNYRYLCPVRENSKNKTLKCQKEINTNEENNISCYIQNTVIKYNPFNYSFIVTDSDSSLCKEGGIKIIRGIDLNENGKIELSENKSSELICKKNEAADNECTITEGEKGAIITCGNKKLEVKDQKGDEDINFYDPCGPNGDDFNEVFIKLSETNYLAVYNNPDKTSIFVQVPKGDYYTNDSQNCHIRINENGSLTEFN